MPKRQSVSETNRPSQPAPSRKVDRADHPHRVSPLRYGIRPLSPAAHLFEVWCEVDAPDPAGQRLALPAWIPGSYMIREYARHVVQIEARALPTATGSSSRSGSRASSRARGASVALEKIDKHTWQAAALAPGSTLQIRMQVYAWDLSVRGAHLDDSHGFFNGACVFLQVLGQTDRPCALEIVAPQGARYRDWRVATAMPRAKATPRWGFGHYHAADYDALIDHPVEMGTFALASFRAGGVPHHVALTGVQQADLRLLCADLQRVCQQQIDLFGAPPPFAEYLFQVMVVGEGYGGLEHRASTALLCSRNDLPRAGVDTPARSEAYRGFLGLCSHEYFHAWNVKRIRPAAFTPYDLTRENYTRLLWLFEGVTSYYDDLALLRCGLLSRTQYLETLARSLTTLRRTPGDARQSLAESSFDAWIKYYRQDENSPNAQTSYYLKGSLVALTLDLHIRLHSAGRKSLDDVMRLLWRRHGRSGVGLAEDGFAALAEQASGLSLRPLLRRLLQGTAALPLAPLLKAHGLSLHWRAAESLGDRGGRSSSSRADALRRRPVLGVRVKSEGSDLRLTHVLEGGMAQQAGLSAGDLIVAIDGLRPGSAGLDAALRGRRVGERVRVHAFRRDELRQFEVRLAAAPADTAELHWDDLKASSKKSIKSITYDAISLRRRWLGQGA